MSLQRKQLKKKSGFEIKKIVFFKKKESKKQRRLYFLRKKRVKNKCDLLLEKTVQKRDKYINSCKGKCKTLGQK